MTTIISPKPHFCRFDGGKAVKINPDKISNPFADDVAVSFAVGNLAVLSENGTASLILGTLQNPAGCENVFADTPEIGEKWRLSNDGYRLLVNGEKDTVAVMGADEKGVFYGLQTLIMLAEQGELPSLYIEDYADLAIRGPIEGFYGYPWSYDDRNEIMEMCAKIKMNTYIYAPKDDPYHRAKWRDLYPEKEQGELRRLVETANKCNFDFVWTLHPGDTIDLKNEDDFNSTIAKLNQLYEIGLRRFGVFFDDIKPEMIDGAAQAEFLNRIDDEFVKSKGDVESLITVGAKYRKGCEVSVDEYYRPFADSLHSDIEVMWTGDETGSNISHDIMQWPIDQTETKKKTLIWWNYPVNDYCNAKLLMGRLDPLKPDLDNVTGMMSNPLSDIHASMPALYSVANYCWNTAEFNAQKSFDNSFKYLVPEAADEMAFLAQNTAGLRAFLFKFEESWDFKPLIEKNATGELNALFKRLKNSCLRLKEIENRRIVKDAEEWIDVAEKVAEAGIILTANPTKSDIEKAKELLTYKVIVKSMRGDFPAEVGMHHIRPYLNKIIEQNGIEMPPIKENNLVGAFWTEED